MKIGHYIVAMLVANIEAITLRQMVAENNCLPQAGADTEFMKHLNMDNL